MKFSVIVCNYNYAAFIDAAIRSALEQDYRPIEVIVVDDGSTDGSRERIARWANRCRVLYKENGGQISAYNAGFAAATGDLVIFLDSDDMLDPHACSRVAAAFEPDVAKVHFSLRLIDAEGVETGVNIPKRLARGDVSRAIRNGELYDSAPGSGNAYRVNVLRRLMPIDGPEGDKNGADFFAIFGAALLGKVAVAAETPLGSYRIHRPGLNRSLTFGNAPNDSGQPSRTSTRHSRLRQWLLDRLGEEYAIAPVRPNFSVDKQGYAEAIFGKTRYLDGIRAGAPIFAERILPAVRQNPGAWLVKAGLVGWAVGILVLPRRAGMPLARYVCNPASR